MKIDKLTFSMFALLLGTLIILTACGAGGSGTGTASNPTNPSQSTYSISGTVTSGGAGMQNVTITLTADGSSPATVTDANGQYTFTGLANGQYTLTPSAIGCTFTPASLTVTISGSDSTGNNFVDALGYSISGIVTSGTSTGTGLPGVTMTLSGSNLTTSVTATTDTNGNYIFGGLTNGSYTITPASAGSTFTPPAKTVTINGSDSTGNNFTTTVALAAGSLVSLAVTPTIPAVVNGSTVQFKATGTFADSTTQDVTSQVVWTTSDNAKATVDSGGLAAGVSAGAARITATSGAISGSTGLVITVSSAGLTWTPQTSGAGNSLRSVAWSSTLSKFVAVGDGGTIITSSDGISWTTIQNSGTGLKGVTWAGSQFVAVGDSGTILTSSNGASWTPQTSGVPDTTLYSVTWSVSQSQLVTVGTGTVPQSGTVLTSSDGITWTIRIQSLWNLDSVVWSGSQYVAAGSPLTYTSPDGATWTPLAYPFLGTLYGVTWSDTQSQYVAVGGGINRRVTIQAPPVQKVASPLGTRFSMIRTSPDGTTWAAQAAGTPAYLYGVAWAGSQTLFAAVGEAGTIDISPDGVTWSLVTSNTTSNLYGVVWSGNRYVAVGQNGAIATSIVGLPPQAPGSIAVPASTIASQSYTVSWDAAAGTVTNYELQECTNSHFSCCMLPCAPGRVCIQSCPTSVPTVFTGPDLLFTTSKTLGGYTFYYRVRACNSLGCSAYTTGSNGIVVQ